MKKKLIITAIVSMALLFNNCKNSHAKQPGTDVPDTASIKAEIERISKIMKDAMAMNNEEGKRILVSNYEDSVMWIEDGQVRMVSANFFAHDLADGIIDIPKNTKYRFFDNNTVLVTTYRKFYELAGGDTIFHTGREIDVLVKHNNQWKLSYYGFSNSPESSYKASNYTKSNSALYPDYVGVYRISSTSADTVLLINGNLYAASTNDSRRIKLFSINDSTFMAEGFPERMIFEKGANGKITHYALEFQDGQRIRRSKVK
jgi:hypothetical protein